MSSVQNVACSVALQWSLSTAGLLLLLLPSVQLDAVSAAFSAYSGGVLTDKSQILGRCVRVLVNKSLYVFQQQRFAVIRVTVKCEQFLCTVPLF